MNVTSTPRVCLVVPASDQRKVSKALSLKVDEIVFDLEDAVVATGKDDALSLVCEVLGNSGHPASIAVRINEIGSIWCRRDVLDIVSVTAVPLTLVVPKVSGAGDIKFIHRLIRGAQAKRAGQSGATPPVRVDALIETAPGLRDCAEIAASSDLLRALVIGYADLAADLGRDKSQDCSTWDAVRTTVVTAARAARRAVIDGPNLSITADEASATDKLRARALGFDGTWVIHPAQIASATTVFSPTEEQVKWAGEVLATVEEAAGVGSGAVALSEEMLDEAVVRQARAVLTRAALGGRR